MTSTGALSATGSGECKVDVDKVAVVRLPAFTPVRAQRAAA